MVAFFPKTGPLIRSLRLEQRLTQKQLAELLHLSDRTISKWERGAGLPDAGLLPELSRILKIPAEQLLSGELPANRKDVGNMKRIRFYRCPQCGNLLTSTNEAHISCCGRSLSPLLPRKAEGEHFFQAERSDGEWYLTTAHPMEKDHFLTFAAWVDLGADLPRPALSGTGRIPTAPCLQGRGALLRLQPGRAFYGNPPSLTAMPKNRQSGHASRLPVFFFAYSCPKFPVRWAV